VTESSTALVPTQLKFRHSIPKEHQSSLDTRLVWLWEQRFGTVQTIYQHSKDTLDRTAATLIIQAVIGRDLESIKHLFQRLEGGALVDEIVLEQETIVV
jgi:hypothetical protein